jgi:hypothetical protein
MTLTSTARGAADGGCEQRGGESGPGASLSLSADIHLNVLNNSYGRMYL